MILPGHTLGMLGGGQLGRMFTVAARTLGYRVMVLDPDSGSPAGRMADDHVHAAYGDGWALDQLAQRCAAITTEFENIPADTLRHLADRVPVRPGAAALEQTQNRAREKHMIRRAGLATAPFEVVASEDQVEAAFQSVGDPAILKRAALGYDGKGQISVDSAEACRQAFERLGRVPCVLERKLDLAVEVSVVLSRGSDGACLCYPVAENIHQDGILHMSIVPARVPDATAREACDAAIALAVALDYVGLMAVEFFITTEGQLLVNEVAPRPHNSGHFTLDACITSQFEQQVRALCGLPFGDTRLLSPVVMVNLLGDLWKDGEPDWGHLLSHPRAKLHLYGKEEARPGRKMGHFCVLDTDQDQAIRDAERLFNALLAVRADD
ncbi:5-(carboxyamino)imidazole ribonucleotide synthase [Ectothiorhodospira marina]|uniref:N5-carboxyaminoimidazole ribonucleotide synthase n=1 Tax=Ectothiorhodospira marina TaxID=1396821 RepID=A0A1H7K769_9GAMM|nr:5-(carboxyamino)imidazole ribonucleotide synthase [Ectothiorhodospira marina]SEK81755.1 5-(carboxyamino)imidazole ribonucleotide synthase [Ectothiorhodospira marina]